MERTIVVFLALSVCLAQCASLRGNDDPPHGPSHKLEKRCDVCGDAGPPHHGPPPPPGPPLPPPPPPFFRTLQYSGLSGSNDGRRGVFSGAAAAADLNNQAAGQAFSVASSSAGAGGYGGQKRQSGYSGQSSQSQASGFGGQSAQESGYKGQSSRSQSNGFGGQSVQQSGFGSQSSISQSQLARGDGGLSSANSAAQSDNAGGYGQKEISGSASFKESRYSFQSGVSKNFESNGGSSGGFDAGQGGKLQGSEYGGQKQDQHGNSAGLGYEVERIGHSDKQSHLESKNQQQSGNGQLQSVHSFQHGFGSDNQQQTQSSGNGQWEQGGSNSVGASQSGAFSGAGKSSYGASGSESSGQESIGDGQSALSGALNLASQGLQTAQQTQSGCSTCGSGSYALSNAKSKSGNAVAVSIGG